MITTASLEDAVTILSVPNIIKISVEKSNILSIFEKVVLIFFIVFFIYSPTLYL